MVNLLVEGSSGFPVVPRPETAEPQAGIFFEQKKARDYRSSTVWLNMKNGAGLLFMRQVAALPLCRVLKL